MPTLFIWRLGISVTRRFQLDNVGNRSGCVQFYAIARPFGVGNHCVCQCLPKNLWIGHSSWSVLSYTVGGTSRVLNNVTRVIFTSIKEDRLYRTQIIKETVIAIRNNNSLCSIYLNKKIHSRNTPWKYKDLTRKKKKNLKTFNKIVRFSMKV